MLRAGSATRSEKPPTRTQSGHWLTRPAAHAMHLPQPYEGSQPTARPTRLLGTPRPTSRTTPVYSWPSTSGGFHGNNPCVACTSVPQMPAAWTSTTTCPGPASGSGAVSIVKRLSPCQVATFISAPPRGLGMPREAWHHLRREQLHRAAPELGL